MTLTDSAEPPNDSRPRRRGWFHSLKKRWNRFTLRRPFMAVILILVLSNVASTIFNVTYNLYVIVRQVMDERQQSVFENAALPLYNALAYPIGFGVVVWLMRPLARCRKRLLEGETVPAEEMAFCRRRLVNLPFLIVLASAIAWMGGAVFFPAFICGAAGNYNAGAIWFRFGISFLVSAFYATAQSFFLLESFLVTRLYPEFLRGVPAADVRGALIIPFGVRLIGLWLAVAVMPILALLLVTVFSNPQHWETLQWLTVVVALAGIVSGYVTYRAVANDLRHWITVHAAATERVAREDFGVRIEEPRPDEWGLLTDGFNDMTAALGRAQQMRDTFGQFVSPQVRDQVLERYSGLQVSLQEITVLFVDIRGFTRRCAGEDPERIGALLNRFLTLAVGAIEDNGGYVNKFLGDGVLALFGALQVNEHHADLALRCARELLQQLRSFNVVLAGEGQQPIAVGIGIHTGPALVGCFGATLAADDGKPRIRREFSAIGETVNLGQRIEQMTKQLGGPILLSEATRARLQDDPALVDLGAHTLSGAPAPMRLFRTDVI